MGVDTSGQLWLNEDMTTNTARNELLALGLTDEQIDATTGFGLRRIAGCLPNDTVLNKYAAGALSAEGVRNLGLGGAK